MAEDNEPCTDCPEDFAAVTAVDESEPDTAPDPRGTTVTKWGPALLAPIGKPTGDRRRFAAGALTNRDLPLGLKWQRQDGQGHSGSVVIGTLDGVTYDEHGAPTGFGLLFNPDPEQLPRLAEDVREARLLLEQGVIGPSVDLDDMEFHQLNEDDAAQYAADQRPEIEVTRGRISAATLVPIPAFAEARSLPLTEMDPEAYAAELEAHNAALTASVRAAGWDELPVAPPGTGWNAREAAARVREWASSEGLDEAYEKAFLWSDGETHLFPLADVVDGKLSLVPRALFAAELMLADGQTVLPAADQARMRSVLEHLQTRAQVDEEALAELSVLDDEAWDAAAELVEVAPEAFGARFEALKSKLAAKGIKDPSALAAKIGRYKYGKKGFGKLRAGVAAKKVKPIHGARTASAVQEAMVAAANLNAAPDAPLPAEWFQDPKLAEPTALTVTPDGRVFGHLATWRSCHTGFPDTCTTAPKSRSKYAYFHTGAVDTTAGEIAVGRISTGGGHADTRWGFQAAAEHYDSTSTQAAVVRAGEDKHGIWVSGAVVPGADVATLKRSPLSGDWRRIGGHLELVHALSVNSGGFPVPRASMVAGAQRALVAAGVLQVDERRPATTFTPADVEALVIQAVHTARRAEQSYARAMSALGAMDEAGDRSERAKRKMRALAAAKSFAFNPNQPRDPFGKWLHVGARVAHTPGDEPGQINPPRGTVVAVHREGGRVQATVEWDARTHRGVRMKKTKAKVGAHDLSPEREVDKPL